MEAFTPVRWKQSKFTESSTALVLLWRSYRRRCRARTGTAPRHSCLGAARRNAAAPSGRAARCTAGRASRPSPASSPPRTAPSRGGTTTSGSTFVITFRVSSHQASASTLRQLCDDANDTVLIENSGIALDRVETHFRVTPFFSMRAVSLASSQH